MRFFTTLALGALAAATVGSAAEAQPGTLWAAGVTADAGWYDFNKVRTGEESELCWAITAANLIAWWQQQRTAEELPQGVPTQQAVWEVFRASFSNSGSDPDQGVRWWFTGGYEPCSPDAALQFAAVTNTATGSYYKQKYEDKTLVETLFYRGRGGAVTAQSVTKAFYEGFRAGDAFWIGVSYNRPDGTPATHSLTVWGVEAELQADGTPCIKALYMTDSDDRSTKLHRVRLKEVDGMIDFDCPEHPLYGRIGKITITTYTGMRR